tara:strand:+ start:305 stop:982 length:678 start_codon:yes stop_codon:yes gene_type:complete
VIENIKIFGERNSGTIFLNQLLLKNLFNFGLLSCKPEETGSGWKHGFPDMERFSEKDKEEILFIFIIRDLESWLMSMYNNPYHFEEPKTIEDFISNKLETSDSCPIGEEVSAGQGRCVMSLRYAKIKSYLKSFGEAKNAIMVNLEDLQNDNSKFLYFLKNNYDLNMRLPHKRVGYHTKNRYRSASTSGGWNRKYKVVLPEKVVASKRDESLERLVNRLKKTYYYK